ncbi:MAG: glycosyltransferase family 4 protein [Endozoicomonas sp. (ex Botrylloides leachii)]|nr:glycosyltransferase family 4 protein [Endozoicomonas sp. (ex Botrylloides leachii)]
MGFPKDNTTRMKLNFALFNYFPFGGLQRDFLKTAIECHKQGYSITVYTTQWKGLRPTEFDIHIIPMRGSANHQRMDNFQAEIARIKKVTPDIAMVGFNKMAGLDVYFASDTCFMEKAHSERSILYRLMPRYKIYQRMEHAVFKKDAKTMILTLTEKQQQNFQSYYQTQKERFKLLPPGINRNTFIADSDFIRSQYRKTFNIPKHNMVLLFIGSSFSTKGLNRCILALGSLPEEKKQKTTLLVVGGDKSTQFKRQAKRLNIDNRIIFVGAREDIAKIMICADLLIHPAYTESAGMVLVEALAAGLPVLVTENCGYAFHIKKAEAGVVIPVPFEQKQLNQILSEMLDSPKKNQWREKAIQYADKTDLYSLHKHAAQLIIDQAKKLKA